LERGTVSDEDVAGQIEAHIGGLNAVIQSAVDRGLIVEIDTLTVRTLRGDCPVLSARLARPITKKGGAGAPPS